MLDSVSPTTDRISPARTSLINQEHAVKTLAQRVLCTNGAQLLCIARQVAGDGGAALVLSVRDMVRDGDLIPEAWPVDDVIDLLSGFDAQSDHQGENILLDLRNLALTIDRLAVRRLETAPRPPFIPDV